MVIFTATDDSTSCQLCKAVQPTFKELAHVAGDMEEEEFPVFFVEIDFKVNRDIFSAIGLKTAPIVTMVPKTKNKKSITLSTYMNTIGRRNEHSLMAGRELKDFKGFVEKTTKFKFKEKDDMNLLIPAIFVTVVVGVIAAAFYFWSD